MNKATEKQQASCIIHIVKAKRLKYEKESVVWKRTNSRKKQKNPKNVAHVDIVQRELVLTDMQGAFS